MHYLLNSFKFAIADSVKLSPKDDDGAAQVIDTSKL